MSTGDGLRERKKRETRLALSHAAVRLTIERGWDAVSVEEIAAAANVSERTFRNYFAGKAEAVVATQVERSRRIAEELHLRPLDEDLWDSLEAVVQAQFAPTGGPGSSQWVDGMQRLIAEPAVHAEMVRANAAAQTDLTAAIAERTGTDPAADLYPQIVAAVVGAGVGVAMAHWVKDPTRPLAPLLREVFDLVRGGLPAPR